MSYIKDDKLAPIMELVENTRKKAGLADKPFVLGLATETMDGELIKLIRSSREKFVKRGVVSFNWRDRAPRGKSVIYGEELIISVDRP